MHNYVNKCFNRAGKIDNSNITLMANNDII